MNLMQMIKAYGGMVFGQTDYWHPEMNVNGALSAQTLAKYPVDMSAKADYPGEFDEQEIPLVQVDGKLCYLPVTIAQYALGHYDVYCNNGDKASLAVLARCADWFVGHLAEHRPNLWGWQNEHDKAIYALKSPWLSALSQGQAISVLARAYLELKKPEYLAAAQKALKAFFVPVQAGGLVAKLGNDDYYEEYPSPKPSFVLNGFIFALWGLWDLYLVSSSPEAKERYEAGLQTLQNHVSEYNIGWLAWSRYDLYPFKIMDICSIFYHNLHIQQLKAMTLLAGDEQFARLAGTWERAKTNPVRYAAATGFKVLHKLSIRKQSSYVPTFK